MESKRLNYRLGGLSLIAGLLVGLVVSIFRLAIPQVQAIINQLITYGQASWAQSLVFICIFTLMGAVVAYCFHKEPMIGGSGIPQVAGKLAGKLDFEWGSILIYKLIGGILAIGSGLTLGREGPSVQIGASIGQGVGDLAHEDEANKKYLIVGSAGAGMAAAFNAPLAGIIFCVEELMKRTNRRGFMSCSLTIITATLVSLFFFGDVASIKIPISLRVPTNAYPYLFLLGIVIGLSGVLFNKLILKGKALYKAWRVPSYIKSIIPFVVTALFLLWDPRLLGSGEHFIHMPFEELTTLGSLIYFYAIKLILLIIAFCSGIPGGIFFPLLALGSLAGNIYGTTLMSFGVIDEHVLLVFTVIAMAAHFSAIVRAPLTGIILILEMTGGSLDYLFPVVIVSYVSYFVAEVFKEDPIYEALLKMMVEDA